MPQWIHTLTVDASYDEVTCVTGIGIVVQARVGVTGRGPILEHIAEAHTGVAPGAGEMFALFRALEIAKARGFTRIKIRSDYNAMRRHLREHHRMRRTGDNALECKVLDLAREFVWIDFGYVPRRKNQTAHALARNGRFAAQLTKAARDGSCRRA
jgi:ribonuclease HI